MARIITTPWTQNDQMLVLGYKELLQYNLNLPDWTTLRVFMILNVVDATTYAQAPHVNESTGWAGKDLVGFGLKAPDNNWPADGPYCTVSPEHNTFSRDAGHVFGMFGAMRLYRRGTTTTSANSADMPSVNCKLRVGNTTIINSYYNPAAFAATYTILNKGTASQQMRMHPISKVNLQSADCYDDAGKLTEEKMRAIFVSQDMGYTGYGNGVVDWLDTAGDPLPVPGAFYIYWPMQNTRLCIQGIIIEKIN